MSTNDQTEGREAPVPHELAHGTPEFLTTRLSIMMFLEFAIWGAWAVLIAKHMANLGFTGTVFSDDLSMGGAAVAGDIPERARRALAAGCDVLSICNDRPAVLATLEELEGAADPLSQVRLVRLHGRPGMPWDQLLASERWRECRAAVDHCRDAPRLTLDA